MPPKLPKNVAEHVRLKSGLLSVFESEQSAIKRATEKLNKDGYRVVAVSPEGDFDAVEKFKNRTLTVFSLGLYGRKPGVILIAEKVDN